MKIDFSEASTKRGIIWMITAIIGVYGWSVGMDVQPVLLIGATIAGAMGVGLPDNAD